MKFYYDIKFKTGGGIGGHNLTNFRVENGFLILEGYDGLHYTTGYEEFPWKGGHELKDIKSFEIHEMEDEYDTCL